MVPYTDLLEYGSLGLLVIILYKLVYNELKHLNDSITQLKEEIHKFNSQIEILIKLIINKK